MMKRKSGEAALTPMNVLKKLAALTFGGVFGIVYLLLVGLSKVTGLTYNQINIVVYYSLIPALWLYMLLHSWIAVVVWLFGWLVFALVTDFREVCDQMFVLSVKFLLSFKWCGMDYVVSSVFWCVVVPIIITILLW